jgi:hypothetical protein
MMRRWCAALAVSLGAAGTGVALAVPQAQAAAKPCLVVDTNSGNTSASLQAAVTAAAAGDTLFVKGTCSGTTVIGKNLTVSGQSAGGNKTATLNGGGQGTVLTIGAGVTVTLNTLIITGGAAGEIGSGISSAGTLTLNHSAVTGNTVGFLGAGGGIFNAILTGDGGIERAGTLTLNDSTVSDNTSPLGDAGGIYNTGTVILNGNSSISGNNGGSGGGIFTVAGSVTLNDRSTITGNTAIDGAGIYDAGNVTMNGGSTITGNTASDTGGGIFRECFSTLNGAVAGTGGNVDKNQPNDIATGPGCPTAP